MSEEIPVCPECDRVDLYHRQHKWGSRHGVPDWRCEGCGATFDDPVYRERANDGGASAEAILARFGISPEDSGQ